MKLTLSEIAAFVAPVLGGLIGWVIARKKNDAELRKMVVETDGIELKNLHLATKIWKDMVRDLQIEVNQLRVQVQKLSGQIFAFSLENSQLKEEVESLRTLLDKKTIDK